VRSRTVSRETATAMVNGGHRHSNFTVSLCCRRFAARATRLALRPPAGTISLVGCGQSSGCPHRAGSLADPNRRSASSHQPRDPFESRRVIADLFAWKLSSIDRVHRPFISIRQGSVEPRLQEVFDRLSSIAQTWQGRMKRLMTGATLGGSFFGTDHQAFRQQVQPTGKRRVNLHLYSVPPLPVSGQ
jgi:hypothetical protein